MSVFESVFVFVFVFVFDTEKYLFSPAGWSDFVFATGCLLRPLLPPPVTENNQHLKVKKHLKVKATETAGNYWKNYMCYICSPPVRENNWEHLKVKATETA